LNRYADVGARKQRLILDRRAQKPIVITYYGASLLSPWTLPRQIARHRNASLRGTGARRGLAKPSGNAATPGPSSRRQKFMKNSN